MPAPAKWSKELRELLFGTPFGEVYPPRPNPPPPVVDGRTTALRLLKKYLSELTFYRPGGKDRNGVPCPPIGFKVLPENIHIEWPDDPEDLNAYPAAVFLGPNPGEYESIGLNGYVQEETRDVYSPGTVVQWQNEYAEKFVVEFWADTKVQRRSIRAGFETALSPTEAMAGIRFRMPDYYDQLVCFSLESCQLVDDDFATKNRRRVQFTIEMRFTAVALVNAQSLEPVTRTVVDVDEGTGEEVDVETED